jgi:uncharacterized protein YdhG (YjbR/CyaY superfamily)
MITEKKIYKDIDDYIADFPKATQEILQNLRTTIQQAAPEAVEKISYQMPAFTYNGILVYFAAYKNHIGFYPTASGIAAFKNEISGYKNAKGSVQFPIDKHLPIDLIAKIVAFKLEENRNRAKAKSKKK